MDSNSPVRETIVEEPELTPFVCPSCGTEMEPEGEPWPEACISCRHPLDLDAQLAYCRGKDAFTYGQDILMKISPKLRRKNITTDLEMEGLHYYIQAYTSLQLAFQGHLAESQRRLAIEIMSAMSLVFQQHGTISPLEAAYWRALFTELNAQIEIVNVQDKIDHLPQGIFVVVRRWRWHTRLRQLEKALAELNVTIAKLERHIAFVERPRARRKTLPKL